MFLITPLKENCIILNIYIYYLYIKNGITLMQPYIVISIITKGNY